MQSNLLQARYKRKWRATLAKEAFQYAIRLDSALRGIACVVHHDLRERAQILIIFHCDVTQLSKVHPRPPQSWGGQLRDAFCRCLHQFNIHPSER